jgi:hypothetical protein
MAPFSHEVIELEAHLKRAVSRDSNDEFVDGQVQAVLEQRLAQVCILELYVAPRDSDVDTKEH